ncbi:serine/threonine-protein kinase PBS1 [Eutrema salsugineum]|nr:serine/threonine-protein kinase PBS1 [Eutrema salsugineum]XP_024008497.1 serine/threonine-protein kinase PBS1 [Eutrema salsugineum]XP_024008498.1 serine/threonine-protein kinase PBS1 [Eutrema salsugineum]XP_024008499.1 serine/threonine-protein kinase PBS1 [Eutrema salsugineum]XP_024008500.1 serine/threonine-protein kinase PBS1 [Eutrema salsugineum]
MRVFGEAYHPNVINLIGKSFGEHKSAIVYEFMPNGSLHHHLFANARPSPGLRQETQVLDWGTRMGIAVGVAEALVHLHTGVKEIHRDVKVANILLDENLAPKLSDFGLAMQIIRNEEGDETPREINLIKGSRGYVAPETEEHMLVSTKSDVYSYGVFLLVLFTGREAYDLPKPRGKMNITDWLMPIWGRKEYLPLVIDTALGYNFPVDALHSLFFATRMCIDAQALARPSMAFVENMIREAASYPVTELIPVIERRHSIGHAVTELLPVIERRHSI